MKNAFSFRAGDTVFIVYPDAAARPRKRPGAPHDRIEKRAALHNTGATTALGSRRASMRA